MVLLRLQIYKKKKKNLTCPQKEKKFAYGYAAYEEACIGSIIRDDNASLFLLRAQRSFSCFAEAVIENARPIWSETAYRAGACLRKNMYILVGGWVAISFRSSLHFHLFLLQKGNRVECVNYRHSNHHSCGGSE